MKHRATCHCGKVALEFDADITGAMACNCSICQRSGALLIFQPRASVSIQAAPDELTTYTFNKHAIQHKFCKTCGIKVHAEAPDPKGTPMVAINIRCIDGLDLEKIPVQHYNGRAL